MRCAKVFFQPNANIQTALSQVLEGVQGNERLVLNPSDSLAAGDVVTVAPEK